MSKTKIDDIKIYRSEGKPIAEEEREARMEKKVFYGFESVYPEAVSGTSEWFCGQVTPCAEAYEVPDYKGNYIGTRLYLFYKDGTVYEPIPQEKNVFLEASVYSRVRNSFGLLRYDFNVKQIQAYEYFPDTRTLTLLTEIKMERAGDLFNIGMVKEPFMVVQYHAQEDIVDFLWPEEKRIQLEENESLMCIEEGTMILQRWMEDPEYHEEIIYRRMEDASIIKREPGYCVEMPDGTTWFMVS